MQIDYEAKQIIVPMISARIEAINNRKPKEIINKKIIVSGSLMEKEEYHGQNTHRLITQLLKVNGGIQIKKEPSTFIDQKVASDLNLKIGDSITFNIYGNSVKGIITNLRKVNYKDLNINFSFI